MATVFVDGSEGATGAILSDFLGSRPYDLITVADVKNKDERYDAIRRADVAVLCVPDVVAHETIHDLHDVSTTIIDATSCNRINPDWVYGYYNDLDRGAIDVQGANRISNPGCFATGIQTLLRPISTWLSGFPIVISGVTGYSAGGNRAIEKHRSHPCQYRMTNILRAHTHVREVQMRSNIHGTMVFTPSVGSFSEGQLISIPICQHQLSKLLISDVFGVVAEYYNIPGTIVDVRDSAPSSIVPGEMMVGDRLQVAIAQPAEDYIVLHAWYSNLTVGAAGSAVRIIDEVLR